MGSNGTSCNAKQGNPFGPFWDTYNIDFVDSEFYKPLHYYDVYYTRTKQLQWQQYYPAETWPVLAFTGAPASFPVQLVNKPLQKCLNWNNDILNKAKAFIKEKLPRGAFVGIHLRNGIDWVCYICCTYFYTDNMLLTSQGKLIVFYLLHLIFRNVPVNIYHPRRISSPLHSVLVTKTNVAKQLSRCASHRSM